MRETCHCSIYSHGNIFQIVSYIGSLVGLFFVSHVTLNEFVNIRQIHNGMKSNIPGKDEGKSKKRILI